MLPPATPCRAPRAQGLRPALLGVAALLVVGLVPGRGAAQRQEALRKELEGIELVERHGSSVPSTVQFTDEVGRTASLGGYAGRPILLTFNYSSCPMLCSIQLSGLARGLKELTSGGATPPFELVTIDLDPSEPIAKALRMKQGVVRQTADTERFGRGWHFLVGSELSINAVADAVGFHYTYDRETREYRHKASVTVLTPDGRVSSYLHGINYPARDLRTAIERAARGEIFTREEQNRVVAFLFDCFSYDPTSRAPLAILIVRIGGILSLLVVLAIIAGYALRDHRLRTRKNEKRQSPV